MIWLYAICDRPEAPVPPPLSGLHEGSLLAVFGRRAHAAATIDALWEHERVVEGLMSERTVLPARFGSTFESEDGVRRMLAEGRVRLLDLIARVRGRVELGVRVAALEREPVLAGATSGRDYLQAKLHTARQASGIDGPLSELAVQTRRQPAYEADELLRASYLVERSAVPGFRATVERLQGAHPELAILCTGPWPAYSFMDGE